MSPVNRNRQLLIAFVFRAGRSRCLAATALVSILAGAARSAGENAAGQSPFALNLLAPGTAGTAMARGAPPRASAESAETFGVRLAEGGKGVNRQGDRVWIADSLAVENEDGVIVLEAEAVEAIGAVGAMEGPEVRNDAACSGGRYVADPAFLSIPFRVAKAGAYDTWLRVRADKARQPVCFWGIDGERRTLASPWAAESPASTPDARGKGSTAPVDELAPWTWAKAVRTNLVEGDHRFRVQRIGRFTVHVDSVALVRAGGAVPQWGLDRNLANCWQC